MFKHNREQFYLSKLNVAEEIEQINVVFALNKRSINYWLYVFF